MSPEQLKELEQTIAASFWRCNELSKEQAEAYAGLAMNHVKGALSNE